MLHREVNVRSPLTGNTTPTSVMFADSASEAVDFLRRNEPAYWPDWRQEVKARRIDGIMGTLGVGYSEALRLAQDGWEEGVAMMHHGLAAMLNVNAPGISRWRNDIAGERPDMDRFLSGDPRSMRRRSFSKGGQPVIHIVINTAMQGMASDKQTLNYGIAMLGLIDFLESRGKRVELDRLGVVTGNGRRKLGQTYAPSGRSMQGWKVKRAEEPADLAAIAFAIAHPASHRCLVWSMRAHCKAVAPAGSAASINKTDAMLIGAEDAFIIDSVGNDGSKCNTPGEALILAATRLNHAAKLAGYEEPLIDIAELKLEMVA